MIGFGIMIAAWGALVIGVSRHLHESTREMLHRNRAVAMDRLVPGSRFIASARGLTAMRAVGAGGVAVGAALLAAGLLR